MSADDLNQLKQRIVELIYRLERMECKAWEMTKLAFDSVAPASDGPDDE